MKYYTICLDGIDKSGKDTVALYLDNINKGKYLINVRGIMTMNAYSKKFNRNINYDLYQQKNIINVLLIVDEDDWNIRCKLSNEPKINYKNDMELFLNEYKALKKLNYPCLLFNTSEKTLKQITNEIIKYADKLNGEN